MIVFVVPLKSAKVSASWKTVSQLFDRCVRSICNQTSTDFRVIVVCHEIPKIQFQHPNLAYIQVDFPAPNRNSDIKEKRQDRKRKAFTGLVAAREFEPSHVMVVDADDCVSQDLAEFVNHRPDSHGWFFEQGYEYKDGSDRIFLRKEKFHLFCGSSHILKYDSIDLPKDPINDDLSAYSTNHKTMKKMMSDKGCHLESLPFPGAVYVIENGENLYFRGNRPLQDWFDYKELISRIKKLYKTFTSERLSESVGLKFGLFYDSKEAKPEIQEKFNTSPLPLELGHSISTHL